MLATQEGLLALYFKTQLKKMEIRFSSTMRQINHRNPWLMKAEAFVACYFAGDLCYEPEIPFVLTGTTFQMDVWSTLTKIPPGHTRTYSQIANAVQRPKAFRAVGAAIGQNPIAMLIPCHRGIAADKKVAGYAGGLRIKQFLLRHEKKSSMGHYER